jgi:hypothetical protein
MATHSCSKSVLKSVCDSRPLPRRSGSGWREQLTRRVLPAPTSVVSHVRIRTYFHAKYVRIRLCTYRTYSYVLLYVFSVRIVRISAFVLKTVRSYSYVFFL